MLRFGPFSMDSRTRLLLRDGREVTLSPRRFVRTMHRFGCRFIGDVYEADAPLPSGEPAAKYWLVWKTRQAPITDGDNPPTTVRSLLS